MYLEKRLQTVKYIGKFAFIEVKELFNFTQKDILLGQYANEEEIKNCLIKK